MRVFAGIGGVIYMRYLDDAKKDLARAGVKVLSDAVDAYSIKNGYPDNLQALTQPDPGGKPFLQSSALKDPWGNDYQYQKMGQHNAQYEKPDIWSLGPKPGDPGGIIGNWSTGP